MTYLICHMTDLFTAYKSCIVTFSMGPPNREAQRFIHHPALETHHKSGTGVLYIRELFFNTKAMHY